jgi:hypothetical protein
MNKVLFYKRWRNWRWTVTAENGQKVGASTEGYRNRDDCLENFRTLTGRVIVPEPDPTRGQRAVLRGASWGIGWRVVGLDGY